MKILYKQFNNTTSYGLNALGVENCYLKKISFPYDKESVTTKEHHHTEFELHILLDGLQIYEVDSKMYRLEGASFLLIAPNTSHKVVSSTKDTSKYSITFKKEEEMSKLCIAGALSERIKSNVSFILSEANQKKEISSLLIENSILEILVEVFRLSGTKESVAKEKREENLILTLAKQYIYDNIELNPSVGEVAKYCCFSTKQLTRIFERFDGNSPRKYMNQIRMQRIQNLLLDDSLSLKKISEIMSFNNEYYFNTFFKKHSGTTPGVYRKMLGK